MPDENKFLRALQSRKLWMAIVGFIAILWTAYQSGSALDPDTVVTAIMGIVGAYIAATAWEDGKRHEAAGEVNAAAMTATQPSPPTVGIDAENVQVTPSRPPTLGDMGD